MFGTTMSILFPWLDRTGRYTDHTKPYYLQCFTFFTSNVYWIFLLYSGFISFGDDFGLTCTSNDKESSPSVDIAAFICLMQESYTVNHYQFYDMERMDESAVGPRDPHLYYLWTLKKQGISPGINPFNNTVNTKYRYMTNFLFFDIAIVIQMILFQIPEIIWTKFRADKHESMFSELDWNVPDMDLVHEKAEVDECLSKIWDRNSEARNSKNSKNSRSKNSETEMAPSKKANFQLMDDLSDSQESVQESKNLREHNPKLHESSDEEEEDQYSEDSLNAYTPPKNCHKITKLSQDPRIAKLDQIRQSHFVFHLLIILIAELGTILGMTLLWDFLFSTGNREMWSFSLFGPKLAQYWYYVWNWTEQDRRLPYVYPGEELFPTITKCSFVTYGTSGSPQISDRLCALEANYIFEKMLIFFWFYYAVFILVIFWVLIADFLYLAIPPLRRRYIQRLLCEELPDPIANYQRTVFHSNLPEDFYVPYQIAVFAVYLYRAIGKDRARNALRQYLISINRPKQENFVGLTLDELEMRLIKRKQVRAHESSARAPPSSPEEGHLVYDQEPKPAPDDLYGHYLSYLKRINSYAYVWEPEKDDQDEEDEKAKENQKFDGENEIEEDPREDDLEYIKEMQAKISKYLDSEAQFGHQNSLKKTMLKLGEVTGKLCKDDEEDGDPRNREDNQIKLTIHEVYQSVPGTSSNIN